MTEQLREDEIVITNFKIESMQGIKTDLSTVPILEKYIAYYSVEKSFLKNFEHPWILYDGRYGLDILSRLDLSDTVIEYLQSNPLYIFLYEDIETAVGERVDLPKAVIEQDLDTALNAQIQYENSKNNLQSLHCYDFDYIREFSQRNKLGKIYICSNAYVPDLIKQIYNEFEFLFFSPFLSEESRNAIEVTLAKDEVINTPLSHKFWCGNWRYTQHRHIIASYLANKDCRLSWAYTGSVHNLNQGLWFDIREWPSVKLDKIKEGVAILNKDCPLIINENIEEVVEIEGTILDLEKYPVIDGESANAGPWKNGLYIKNNTMCFCAIVTESRFAEYFSSFSEKPMSPIAHFMPFVIVGLPNTLKLLRRIGFKTFGDFWDESYDDEINNEKRLLKILDVIDYIDSFRLDDLTELKKQMMPILEHNYNLLRTLPFETPLYN